MTRGRVSFDTVERRLDVLDDRWDRIRVMVSTIQQSRHRAWGDKRGDWPTIAEARERYPHGTHARYVLGRCRCFPCRVSNSRYEADRSAAHRKRWRVQPIGGGYFTVRDSLGDVGEVFRTKDPGEAAGKRDELNERDKRGERPSQLVSVRDVVKHLRWLQSQGIGPRTVSAVSGVSYSVLQRMLGYPSGGKPIDRTRRATAERILAVGLSDAQGGQNVPIEPTLELVRCLLSAGWTRTRIAVLVTPSSASQARTGSRRDGVRSQRPGLQFLYGRKRVRATTARRVELIHREAWRLDPRVRAVCRHERTRMQMENADQARAHGTTVRELERAAHRRSADERRRLSVESREGVSA